MDIYSIFMWVLKSSLMGVVIILITMSVKLLLGNKLSVKWHYYIWFILLIRLMIPSAPGSSFSIYNFFDFDNKVKVVEVNRDSTYDFIPQSAGSNSIQTGSNNVSLSETQNKGNNLAVYFSQIPWNNSQAVPSKKMISLDINLLIYIWLAGVFVFTLYMFIPYFILMKKIRNQSLVSDTKLIQLVKECKLIVGIRTHLDLIQTPVIKVPALFGLFKPKLLLPLGILGEFASQQLKYILLHELAHLKRKDILINWIAGILQILHWFNPFIWFGFWKMRKDSEVACDALVLSLIGQREHKEYGQTIINLFEVFAKPSSISGVLSISGSWSEIKRRIFMISSFKKSTWKLSLISIALVIILSCTFLTNGLANVFEIPNSLVANEEDKIFNSTMIKNDNISLPFEKDPEIVGKWKCVDYIKSIEDFFPDIKSYNGDLYFNRLYFSSDGSMPLWNDYNWTRGFIINKKGKTAGKYILKVINNKKYLFFEWKSYDYIYRNMKPWYYVAEQIDIVDYLYNPVEQIEDKIDYPFVYDPEVIGEWKTVDFVSAPNQFDPNNVMFQGESGITLVFNILGLANMTMNIQDKTAKEFWRWTKGLAIDIDAKTASKYEIKNINGSTYMFMEWKSGDYTLRGLKPNYYVLKKVD